MVDAGLHDHADRLKESVIGVEVYRRDPSYDPRTEPIVRTEARRLRAKLDEYYQTLGPHDPVRIDLPKGGYVPRFEFRPAPAPEPIREPEAPRAPDPPPPPPPRRSRLPWVAAACLVGAVAVLYLLLRPASPALWTVVTPLTSYPGDEFQPALSPDGKQFAFVYNAESDNYDIYVKLLDTGTPLRLTTNPAHDVHPAWSPDGRYIAFLRVSPTRKELFVVPSLGGAERKIADISAAEAAWSAEASVMHDPGPAWSPDGLYLAIGDRQGSDGSDAIYLIELATGKRRKLTSPDPASIGDSRPAFSPDGRRLAFVRTSSQRGIMDVFSVPVEGGAEKQLTNDRKTIGGLTWASSSRILFSSNRAGGNTLWSMPARGGRPDQVLIAGRGVRHVAASADGTRVLYTDRIQNSNIWRVKLASGHAGPPERFLASTGRNDSPQYSPDGRRIVFGSDRSGWYEIWTANADGSNLLQLTSFRGLPVGSPRWSPDGREIVFDAVKDGRSVLYRMDSNGGQPQLFVEDAGDAMMPTWSRDGRSIYFSTRREGSALTLWKKPAGGGALKEIMRDGSGDALESADGREFICSDIVDGIRESTGDGAGVHLIPALAAARTRRYCAVTSRGIYFLRSQEPPEIDFYDFATRQTTALAVMSATPVSGTPSLTASPDDQWLLYAQVDAKGSDIMMLTGLP